MNRTSHDVSRLRRTTRSAGLCLLLALAALPLAQCRSVGDTVAGVDLSQPDALHRRSSCHKRCDREYREARVEEILRYREARRACGHDSDCRRREARIHGQKLDELKLAQRACKRGCYNEGGGHGGRGH